MVTVKAFSVRGEQQSEQEWGIWGFQFPVSSERGVRECEGFEFHYEMTKGGSDSKGKSLELRRDSVRNKFSIN